VRGEGCTGWSGFTFGSGVSRCQFCRQTRFGVHWFPARTEVWYGVVSFATWQGNYRLVSKSLSIAGLVVSGLVVVLFVADLAAAFPFARTSWLLDVAFIVSGLIVGYLSWSILDQGKRRPVKPSGLR
jgi:hypothetical protein